MLNENDKLPLISKIKINLYLNELADMEKFESEIQDMVVKYLVEQCGAGNFEYDANVQYQ